jgi:phosphatidylserine/phosphatidylglycerophosphate/cardiolipin synthase-like enzyme
VGSHNLNALSDYGSLEANIECMDEGFALETQQEIDRIILEGCTEVHADTFIKNTGWIKQAYRWTCYVLVRLSLALLFVFMRKDRSN